MNSEGTIKYRKEILDNLGYYIQNTFLDITTYCLFLA